MEKRKKLNVLPANTETPSADQGVGYGRFPPWLHRKMPQGNGLKQTQQILEGLRLPTVCEEAKCPNQLECWSQKTATFLAMGKACTRNCGFCDIDFSKQPTALLEDEPFRLAASVKALGLRHVVITMVARDDLEDGGASHLVKIISEVRQQNPTVRVEVLTSDFNGNREALRHIIESSPEVFNHNIETVRRLTPSVRHRATYERSLSVLQTVSSSAPGIVVKSGMMVGLGEHVEEVYEALKDLKEVGCKIVTIGQYLQPQRHKLRVKAFITPEQFQQYADYGRTLGIQQMYCGPFVRSSYHAGECFDESEA